MRYKKILLLLSLVCLIIFLLIKIFADQPKEKGIQNHGGYTISNFNHQNSKSYQGNQEIEKINKVIEVLENIKNDKSLVYELRRKFEKQDLFELISNKENFKTILKSLNYTQEQKEIIVKNFGNQEEFFESTYRFYLYLIIANLDDSMVTKLKEHLKFINQKIYNYKIDPKVLGDLKSRNDPTLNSVIEEIEKNIYQPNLSKEKKEVLFSEIKKISYILNLYETFQKDDVFSWVKSNKEDILKKLRY